MGNVNGREEEGAISPSSGCGGEGESHNSSEVMVASDESHVTYPAPPPEMMGHSPPHSPRATHSPLMFTPQVPVVPLQRPDEIQVPSHSWMQNSLGYEEMCNEQGIPTMITWTYGGKEVAVEGSWDDWKTRMPLQRSGKDYTIMKVLPSGVYQYRFIVDGQWRYAPDLPWAKDDSGNAYNTLDLQHMLSWCHCECTRTLFQKTLKVYLVLNPLILQSQATATCNLVTRILRRSHQWFLRTYK
ncbi:SNF1-related protein kinase regulatory subunit beta-2 isoform X2 [Populus trichocarpa]|uniref:SNF1-related protein kinase regulatory subunit beta-2 isoform X2 n=1 Tax=Populus trichocarpa TaxID=3694 RepID=UPI002277F0E8|nr:SNF1-related protein kinase regulatory subunit beta-2 isoform X2 [Populus trichocarpa]